MIITKENFEYCRYLVKNFSGVVLDDSKEYIIESRLRKLLRDQSIESFSNLFSRLKNNSNRALIRQVVEQIINAETQFFRDRNFFETLKLDVFPKLRDRLIAGQKINVWCAASSSGQEPYSVAILLAEHFPDLAIGRVRLIGSDLSRRNLQRARGATYSPFEVGRGLSKDIIDKYFVARGSDWQILPRIREQVEFTEVNLVESWPPLPPMDLILLRNVLVYFSDRTKRLIIEKARRQAKPGGYLFLGATEAPSMIDGEFERIRLGRSIGFQNNLG